MTQINVLDWNKQSIKSIELPDSIFAQPVAKHLLHDVVKWQLAKKRKGNHQTKTRALVSGGGKKPFKQKGSGRARQGSIRSPLMRGGGVIFGPSKRDYDYTLPRKIKRAALRSALSYLVKEKRFHVVSEMTSQEGKTKALFKQLQNFGILKTVLIDHQENIQFKRAARNIPNICYYSTQGLNVYDLLKYNSAIVTEGSIQNIITRCQIPPPVKKKTKPKAQPRDTKSHNQNNPPHQQKDH